MIVRIVWICKIIRVKIVILIVVKFFYNKCLYHYIQFFIRSELSCVPMAKVCLHFHSTVFSLATRLGPWTLTFWWCRVHVDMFTCCILLLRCPLFVDICCRVVDRRLYGVSFLELWFILYSVWDFVLLCEASRSVCSVRWYAVRNGVFQFL
jgi:hypothetical protein